MKSLKHLVVVTIFAALASTGLHSQTVNLLATIPFEFQVGDKLMPAGEYQIQEHGATIWLRNEASGKPSCALLTVGGHRDRSHKARLDFNVYGSEYFLATVWSPYSEDARKVLPTARQKELSARGAVPAQEDIILASK